MDYINTIVFNFGFTFNGVNYGWHQKKLHRLPFIRNQRSYGLKIINPILVGSTICYNIQREKLTINRIKDLTKKVDWKIEEIKTDDCPF